MISLTGAGSLGVRLGHLFGRMMDLLAFRGAAVAGPIVGTSAGYPALFVTLNADLAAGTALPKTQQRFAPFATLASWDSGQGTLFSQLAGEAQAILAAMYNLDQAAPTQEDAAPWPACPLSVLQYFIRQMTGSTLNTPTSTVQGATVSAGSQTNVNTPTGNPVILMSVKRPDGSTAQLIFPETFLFTTILDQQGGATAGVETIAYAGEAAAPDVFSYQFPGGSGSAGSLSCVNPNQNNDGVNLDQNGDFQTFTTANTPDNWNIVTGTVGTQILDGGSGNVYTTGNTHVLEFAGDGSTLTAITQSFNTTPATTVNGGGTSYALLPDTVYGFNCWIKASATPAAGVLQFDLIDGAGNILADDFGTANTVTKSLTAVSTSWVNVNGVFRTPMNLTTQTTPFKLRVWLSTALSNTKNLFIARLGFTAMSQLYLGGPYCAIFSGNTATINGLVPDQWTLAMSNNYQTTGNGLFQSMFDRTFGLRQNNLQLPYKSSAPTIADSLIA